MDNKLSELSTPAGHFIEWQDEETGERECCECSKENGAPLYSQEYVSALLADNEAKDKRIAELEQDELATRASSRAVHEAQENHINQQQDIIESLEKKNVDLGRALGAAEKRLATPVRLPDPDENDYGYQSISYLQAIDAINDAGFTVEGDE